MLPRTSSRPNSSMQAATALTQASGSPRSACRTTTLPDANPLVSLSRSPSTSTASTPTPSLARRSVARTADARTGPGHEQATLASNLLGMPSASLSTTERRDG